MCPAPYYTPTYPLAEIESMIGELNYEEAKCLVWVVMEEKKRYTLDELHKIKKMFDEKWEALSNTRK